MGLNFPKVPLRGRKGNHQFISPGRRQGCILTIIDPLWMIQTSSFLDLLWMTLPCIVSLMMRFEVHSYMHTIYPSGDDEVDATTTLAAKQNKDDKDKVAKLGQVGARYPKPQGIAEMYWRYRRLPFCQVSVNAKYYCKGKPFI